MASEIRVDKINSLSGVGTVTLSPTGVDIAGITTAATLRATTGIITSLTAVSSAKVGSGVTLSPDGDAFFTGVCTATSFVGNGSGLTNLSTDLVNDTSPQLGGDLDTNDFEILLDDNHKIKFGAGNDLTIESDGTNGLIKNHVGGGIYIRANTDVQLSTNASDGGADNALKCVNNGGVELYYDNTKICETTTNGLALVSGKGIDFSATSDLSGSSSELLDDYEEGTYTSVLTGSGGGSHNVVGCPYVKVGKQVSVQVTLANPGSNSVSGNWTFTLPFQAVQTSGYAYFGGYVTYTRNLPGFSEGDGNFCNYSIHTYNGQSTALFYKVRNGSGEANLVSGSLDSNAILAWTIVYNTST